MLLEVMMLTGTVNMTDHQKVVLSQHGQAPTLTYTQTDVFTKIHGHSPPTSQTHSQEGPAQIHQHTLIKYRCSKDDNTRKHLQLKREKKIHKYLDKSKQVLEVGR